MLFNSYQFLVFFPIVVLLYFVVPKRVQHIWLLAASYYFYMCWEAKYIVLLLFVTIVSYFGGRMLEGIERKRIRKWVVIISSLACLSLLCCFKYFDFLLSTLNSVIELFHGQGIVSPIHFVLPVGISFYTFQAIGYLIDVYRKEIAAEKGFLNYALFVSFFPQLVAGPIERSGNLLEQIKKRHFFSFERMREGLLIMMWGFFLKLVIADRTAVFVDAVYNNYQEYGGYYLIVATILFGIQIYCDFAGYSTIAVGAAHILGIRLMENFDCPYLAQSVAEFWRRWHISLTSWFRDYLYIPLGGNRKGKGRKYLNILIVFLASGLWHGAEWSFVLWGGLNGLYQIIGELLRPVRAGVTRKLQLNPESLGSKVVKVFFTFVLVDFAWIFFRAPTIQDAFGIIKNMVTVSNPWILMDGSLYELGIDQHNFCLMLLAIGILLFADCMKRRGYNIRGILLKQDVWCRWFCYLAALFAIVILGRYGTSYGSTFIYFQF